MKITLRKIKLKNEESVTLRGVTPSDAQSMLNHLQATHSESYKNLNQTAEFWHDFSVEKEKEILSDFSSSKSKFLIVATIAEKIIGGLGVVASQGPFHNKNGRIGMSIQSDFSNLGLGTHMMEFAKDTARSYGFHRLELTVRSYNTPGISLYEKTGFEKVGTLKQVAFIDRMFVDEHYYQLLLNS